MSSANEASYYACLPIQASIATPVLALKTSPLSGSAAATTAIRALRFALPPLCCRSEPKSHNVAPPQLVQGVRPTLPRPQVNPELAGLNLLSQAERSD